MSKQTTLLYVGIHGHVVALDRATGEIAWATKLRRGSSLVPITRDERSVYALSGGEVSCLDPGTGEVRWHNPLRGFGMGYATFGQDLPPVVAMSAALAAQAAAAAAASSA